MPLSLSGTGNLQSMSKIVVTNAIDNVEPVAVMKELVTTYDIPAGHYQVSVPIWDRMSAAALTEGVDLFSPTVVAATVRNVPASEHGILTFVSDRLQHQNNEDVLAQIGVQHGNALGRLMDDDLLVLVDGFSLSAPGAGLAATFLHITGAISQLNSEQSTTFGPVPSQPNCVLNPEQIRRMVQEVAGMQGGTTTGMSANPIPSGISEDVIKRYWRGNDALFGVPIFMMAILLLMETATPREASSLKKLLLLQWSRKSELAMNQISPYVGLRLSRSAYGANLKSLTSGASKSIRLLTTSTYKHG